MAEGVLSEVPKGSRVISLISFGDASAQGFTGRILINPSGKKNWRSAGLLRVTPGGGPLWAPPNLYPFKESPFFGLFQGNTTIFLPRQDAGRSFYLATGRCPGLYRGMEDFRSTSCRVPNLSKVKRSLKGRKSQLDPTGKLVTSDHRVAGSSHAGCKVSPIAELRTIPQPKNLA